MPELTTKSALNKQLQLYKRKRRKKYIKFIIMFILWGLVIFPPFHTIIWRSFIIVIEILGIAWLVYLAIKTPSEYDLSLREILTEDCDAELWLKYIQENRSRNRIENQIEYAMTLNFVGRFDQAKKY